MEVEEGVTGGVEELVEEDKEEQIMRHRNLTLNVSFTKHHCD
jgi:hypothetical protein